MTKVIRVANEIPDDKLIRIASPWKNVFINRNVYAIVIILDIDSSLSSALEQPNRIVSRYKSTNNPLFKK
ncbi:MAG TPA: hypothetical protein VF220_07365 [Nitrososphaeraceae archaeon]